MFGIKKRIKTRPAVTQPEYRGSFGLGHLGFTAAPAATKIKRAPFTVADIHREFDTAVDSIINQIINADPEKIAKTDELSKLGFYSAKPVVENNVLSAAIKTKNYVGEQAAYFRQHYPFNKFITENLVGEICKKYGLLFGDAHKYIGDIPEKNIAEITSFKLRKEDKCIYICGWYDEVVTDYGGGHRASTWFRVAVKSEKSVWGFQYTHSGSFGNSSHFNQVQEDRKEVEKENQKMRICAPEKDFEINTARQDRVAADGYTLIDDPIVLMPVTGGYLIVSKWGGEAADEKVVNSIEN